jgi:flavin-dependent dehydrogenase
MAKTNVQHDVIVIGAGIAGLVAANRAAQLGKRVIVLEKSE